MQPIAPSNLLPVQGAARDAPAAEDIAKAQSSDRDQTRTGGDPASFDTVFGAMVPKTDEAAPTVKTPAGDIPPEVDVAGGEEKAKSVTTANDPDGLAPAVAAKPPLETGRALDFSVAVRKSDQLAPAPTVTTHHRDGMRLANDATPLGGVEAASVNPDKIANTHRSGILSEKSGPPGSPLLTNSTGQQRDQNHTRHFHVNPQSKAANLTPSGAQVAAQPRSPIARTLSPLPIDPQGVHREPVALQAALQDPHRAEHRLAGKGALPAVSNTADGLAPPSPPNAQRSAVIALPQDAPAHWRPRQSKVAKVPAQTQPIQVPPPTPIMQSIQTAPHSVQLVQDASKLTIATTESEPLNIIRSDAIASQTTGQSQTLPQRLDAPQHVARQVAEALQSMPSRPVEISLKPEELGRVRLAMSSTEAGIMVSILTERPETMDLMRRHIANLETAFQEIGYEQIAFSFANGENTEGGNDADMSQGKFGTDLTDQNAVETAAHISLTLSPDAGLDLRL